MDISRNLGWKVLRVFPGERRTSAFATTGALEYPRGKRVTPRSGCGPLTLFNHHGQAEHFAHLFGGGSSPSEARIIPVKYEEWVAEEGLDYSLWQPKNGPSVRGEGIQTYGKRRTVNRVEVCIRHERDLPMGTVLASSITCLE